MGYGCSATGGEQSGQLPCLFDVRGAFLPCLARAVPQHVAHEIGPSLEVEAALTRFREILFDEAQ